ncbi:MAG: alpha/beta hydrolase [Candidatus Bathyarchaeota archaeon]|nr:alpha/beta hydrolase [Candidatus Bathyarchaeota archaeon]
MKTKFSAKLNQKNIPLSAFCLTALAAVLVIAEGVFWAYTQALFVARFDFEDLLFHFGPGLMLALTAVLLLRRQPHNKVLGVGIGIFALLSAVAGGGFLVGFALGIIGAVLSLFWNSQMRVVRPIHNRLMKLTKKNRAAILLAVVVIAVLVVVPTELNYQLAINAIQAQTLSESKLVNTSHGLLEYTDVGEGYPVLVSHGAGMGYIQLESVQQMLENESFRLIVPSRFGYLRTPMPKDASVAAQADAYAELLGSLNISKVILMGLSIGGPTALSFALRHPDKCSALIMSMAISHNTPPFDFVGNIMHNVVFRSDLGVYTLSNTFHSQFLMFLGVSQQVQTNMTNKDKEYVNDILRVMQPISVRQAGTYNDAVRSQTELNLPIETIKMPTIVFHAKDDGLVNFEYGQYTAQHVPGAKFVPFESGGHLLVGQLSAIHDETMSFLRQNEILS